MFHAQRIGEVLRQMCSQCLDALLPVLEVPTGNIVNDYDQTELCVITLIVSHSSVCRDITTAPNFSTEAKKDRNLHKSHDHPQSKGQISLRKYEHVFPPKCEHAF
jgi:hypothetical protein